MGLTPRRPASRRIVREPTPSASATARAPFSTRSRLRGTRFSTGLLVVVLGMVAPALAFSYFVRYGPVLSTVAQRRYPSREGDPVSTTQQAATDHDEARPAARPTQAALQARYGAADVLHYPAVARPAAGGNDVLIRGGAAGVHMGDWHLMSGHPYLMRIMGFGLRAP